MPDKDALFTFNNAAKNIAIGGFAGMVTEILEYPLDLAKVRLQAQVLLPPLDASQHRSNGTVHCLRHTWKDEGFRGLYRGLPAPLVGSMAITAAIFVSYTTFQDVIRACSSRTRSDKLSIPELALAAAGAGFAASYIVTPIELVKCKMQVQMMNISPQKSQSRISANTLPLPMPTFSPNHASTLLCTLEPYPNAEVTPRPPGPWSIIRTAVQTEGFRGLWKGHTGTIVRDSGGSAGWFAIKEYVSEVLLQRRGASGSGTQPRRISTHEPADLLHPWESAVAGAVAGAVCVFAFHPVDTIKSAMQTEDELRPLHCKSSSKSHSTSARVPSRTFSGTLTRVYAAHGLRGLYAGCGMTVARAVPSSGILFVVYDGLSAWLR